MGKYEDIIDHPHHQSKTRPHMNLQNRAAQFAPFAALSGYGEAVAETERITEERAILDESVVDEINRKLAEIAERLNSESRNEPYVSITYFVDDLLKDGGSYVHAAGNVKKVDAYERQVLMKDGTVIPMRDIFDVEILD